MARVASMPLTPRHADVHSTTSGASSSACATASSPSSASATTSMPSSDSSTMIRPRRNSGVVVADQDPDRVGPARRLRPVIGRPSAPLKDRRRSTHVARHRRSAGLVDQADVAVVAPVDDRGPPVSALVKKKKSWPSRSICRAASSGVIGFDREPLGFTIRGPAVRRRRRRRRPRRRPGGRRPGRRRRGDRRAGRWPVAAGAEQLGLELVELVLELVDGQVDGGEAVGGGDLAPDVVAVALEGDLAHLLVGDARVAAPRRSAPRRGPCRRGSGRAGRSSPPRRTAASGSARRADCSR